MPSQIKVLCLPLHAKPQLSLTDSSGEAPCEALSLDTHSGTKAGDAFPCHQDSTWQHPRAGVSCASHQISEHNVDLVSVVPCPSPGMNTISLTVPRWLSAALCRVSRSFPRHRALCSFFPGEFAVHKSCSV